MGGHPKHLHANTPHISAISRKVLPVVLFVLPVFIRAPCSGGTETSGSVTRYK